jgi:hypothetical protein
MSNNTSQLKISGTSLRVYTILAALLTTVLCFIDEGHYNFNWVLSWGNWVIFAIYTTVIMAFQIVVGLLIPNKWATKLKIPFSFVVGSALALTILFILFTSL